MAAKTSVAIRLLGMAAVLFPPSLAAQSVERVSKPGQYSGYSPILYDGFAMSSLYVPARDGTRIAVDIVRPTRNGAPVDTRLPVLWMNTPYGRRKANEPLTVENYPGAALALVKYGYVIAVADMRGNYASFGKALRSNRTQWAPWAYWDAYDITEWLAAQPWSDGKIGMWGCSATGHTQWQAAVTAPPHLKAIFPMSAPSEYFDWNGVTSMTPPPPKPYPGPIPNQDARAVPVDADKDGKLLAAAKEEHRQNLDYGFAPYRDSVSPEMAAHTEHKNFRPWIDVNTFARFADLNKSRIPAYQTANFGEDQRVKQGIFIKQRNLAYPVKTLFAPGNHCTWSSEYKKNALNPFDAPTEELRWFDYWLKGVQNGIMDEPAIYYHTYNRPAGQEYSFAWQWPLPQQRSVPYYFAPGSGEGPHHAALSTSAPTRAGAREPYTIDYDVTPANRNDRGMTFTSAPMSADTQMTGHPVVHMWVSSSAPDGDFFAALADIAPDGKVTMLPGTDDGQIRISMRALSKAPYDNLGLPYIRANAADRKPLTPGTPAELAFDLAPISWVFRAGHRFRLVITGSAPDRHGGASPTPVLKPAPVVNFLRDPAHPSRIVMPQLAPITATATITRGGTGAKVVVTFPTGLDARYLGDVRPGSVELNGTPATNVSVGGATLVASFPVVPRGPATIRGAFGGKYAYGEQMRFVATAR